MIRKIILPALLLLLMSSVLNAQTSTGQLCIRAFEDRNANGVQDPNEPPIVRGISATLSNDNGVILDTALMESSSSASSGTLCFQRLAAGQYRLRVSSADYVATTPDDFTTAVTATGVPQVLTYGGQFIPVEAAPVSTGLSQEARLQSVLARAVVGGIGALIVIGTMIVIGAFIYYFVLRDRTPRPQTGAYRPVPDAGQYPILDDTSSAMTASDDDPFARPADSTPSHGMPPAVVAAEDMPDAYTIEDTYDMYDDIEEDDDTNRPTERIFRDPYADTPDDDFTFEDDDPFRPPNDDESSS